MRKLNCLIVDDEPIARDLLEKYIERIPEIQLLKKCKNATEAYEGLYEFDIDLIFLDVQMPLITGTEFLRSLRKPPLVIFTTAYANYAVEGFELNSVDYLLKPIVFERFYQSAQKALERKAFVEPLVLPPNPVDYLFIKQNNKLVKIKHADIDYIQAEKDFSSIFMGEKRLLASMHLKMLEECLPAQRFLRVHRSYIVNLSKINALKGNVIELGNMEIPIGANYRQFLMDKLGV